MPVTYKRGVVTEIRYVGPDDVTRWLGPHSTLRGALEIVERVYREEAQHDLVVTELFGGRHAADSFHYIGRAADLRCNDLRADVRRAVLAKMKTDLHTAGFQVIDETHHFHIEPRGGRADFPLSLAVMTEGTRA
jgi:hypothetical protein